MVSCDPMGVLTNHDDVNIIQIRYYKKHIGGLGVRKDNGIHMWKKSIGGIIVW